jgi:mono/diheme cytochrome c family protein
MKNLLKMSVSPFLLALTLVPVTPVLAADGPALYKQHCMKCHAETGAADSFRGYLYFARNFTNQKWQASHTDEQILNQINRGPGLVMPAFKNILTEEERLALVKVVRGFGQPVKKPE